MHGMGPSLCVFTRWFMPGPRPACWLPQIAPDLRSRDMDLVAVRTEEELRALPVNKWGIPEPSEEAVRERATALSAADSDAPLNVIVVPGLGFDARCQRLGRGKGYYGALSRLPCPDWPARSAVHRGCPGSLTQTRSSARCAQSTPRLAGNSHFSLYVCSGVGAYFGMLLPWSAGWVSLGVRCALQGVAFDCQIVDDIPTEAHDVRLDAVLTESQLFEKS